MIEKTSFFTDRLIYRQGQTVFFKGIMTNENSKKKELLLGKETEVSFIDSNREVIETKTFVTNEFGSFDGSFVIPDNLHLVHQLVFDIMKSCLEDFVCL